MFTQPAMPGEPTWRQVSELQSRKEVIECWLSNPIIPSQLIEVLQELLANTDRQLEVLRIQHSDSTS